MERAELHLTIDFTPSSGCWLAMSASSAERGAYTGPVKRPAGGALRASTALIPPDKTVVKTIFGSGTFDFSRWDLARVTAADVATYGRDYYGLAPA